MLATCFFAVSSVFFIVISARVAGVWFTPLTHYALRWLFLVFLVELNLLGYDEISSLTWTVVVGSFIAFSMGSLLPMLRQKSRFMGNSGGHIKEDLRASINSRKYLKAILVLFLLGTGAFLVFMYNVGTTFGISNFLENGQILRLAMNEGELPIGFHYLYIMELVGPLCFLAFLLFQRQTPKWVFLVMALSIASLFFTTGRTNMMKSFVWIVYVFIFFNIERLTIRKFSRIMGGVLAVALGIFFMIAVWTNKTYEASEISRTGVYSGVWAPLMMPYFYMSVELPVLDKLLQDPNIQHEWGKYTFLPVFKILHLIFPDITVPTHIGQFYNTPLAANIATYLDLMYKDFGLIGPILLPLCLGLISSYLFSLLLFGRATLGIFMINTVLSLTIFSSTSSANYMKPSYWFQVVVVLALSRYCRKYADLQSVSNQGGLR